jgi:hypothetical protein
MSSSKKENPNLVESDLAEMVHKIGDIEEGVNSRNENRNEHISTPYFKDEEKKTKKTILVEEIKIVHIKKEKIFARVVDVVIIKPHENDPL